MLEQKVNQVMQTMSMNESEEDKPANWPGIDDFLSFANSLVVQCSQKKNVAGIGKLERKLKAEMKFLNQLKVKSSQLGDGQQTQSQLNSSNLSQLSSVLHCLNAVPGVSGVLRRWPYEDRQEGVMVDVVAGGGHHWVKVIARKAEALHCIWAGQGQFGERNLMIQAEEMLDCASENPCLFVTPQVHFAFYNQVTGPMATALTDLGVTVWGQRIAVRPELEKMISSHLGQDDDSEEEDDAVYNYDGCIKVREGEMKNLECHIIKEKTDISQPSLNLKNPAEKCLESIHDADVESSHNSQVSNDSTPEDLCSLNASNSKISSKETVTSLASTSVSDATNGKSVSVFQSLVASPPNFSSMHLSPAHGDSGGIQGHAVACRKANLDITSMITLVSAITHGGCEKDFNEPVLKRQAEEERSEPVLPLLKDFLKDKELYSCQSAVTCFRDLVALMGGPGEKERTDALLETVTVVPDDPSPRASGLDCGGKIKDRSKVIFGTGDSLEAITVTSNMGFVRAAQNQGVEFPAFLHSARALTEMKELKF